MAYKRSFKHLKDDRMINRPRINKQRLLRKKNDFVYIPPQSPHLIYRSATVRGLLAEIKHGNSMIKLYALLTLKAILKDCDRKMRVRIKRTYGHRLRELTPAGPVE
jgi:hypothetical protein